MRIPIVWLMLLTLILTSCAPAPVATVDIPDDVKEAIERIAPRQDYVFYALKTSIPATAENLKNRTLVWCMDQLPEDMDLTLLIVSQGYLAGNHRIQGYGCRPFEKCLPDCIKYVQDTPLSILLMKRNVRFDQQKDLIEVVFK